VGAAVGAEVGAPEVGAPEVVELEDVSLAMDSNLALYIEAIILIEINK
jgi:hypothetical protein